MGQCGLERNLSFMLRGASILQLSLSFQLSIQAVLIHNTLFIAIQASIIHKTLFITVQAVQWIICKYIAGHNVRKYIRYYPPLLSKSLSHCPNSYYSQNTFSHSPSSRQRHKQLASTYYIWREVKNSVNLLIPSSLPPQQQH